MRQSSNDGSVQESRRGRWHKTDDGPNSEERALQRFAQMMIEKISSFQGDWKKPWFTEGALTWPKNLSGREYNGMNAMMLMMHCEKEGFKLPVFCTFDRVTSLNYSKDKEGGRVAASDGQGNELPRVSVNKGSKSIPVFITTFTCVDKETKEKIKYDDYKRLSAEEQKGYNIYPKLSVYNVFNVDQTNLKEARPDLYHKLEEQNQLVRPEAKEGEEYTFEPVDHMIAHNEWICPIKPVHGDNAYYSISKKEIVIPEKSQFKDGESFYGNLYHEMAHSTGAEDQLNRLKPTAFGSKDYGVEELTAEMTAALVCQRYGMTKHLKEDSVAYLKGWLDNLKEDPAFIKNVLTDVKKASSMITTRIEGVRLDREVKLDVREENTQTVAVDETGDAQLVDSESLGADRKQGDNEESQDEKEEDDETKRAARSLGRGR
jgi:antirestriction protein ArdC